MLTFKTVSRKTYERNVKSGKWVELQKPTELGGLVKTAAPTRGVYNVAGRVYRVEFSA